MLVLIKIFLSRIKIYYFLTRTLFITYLHCQKILRKKKIFGVFSPFGEFPLLGGVHRSRPRFRHLNIAFLVNLRKKRHGKKFSFILTITDSSRNKFTSLAPLSLLNLEKIFSSMGTTQMSLPYLPSTLTCLVHWSCYFGGFEHCLDWQCSPIVYFLVNLLRFTRSQWNLLRCTGVCLVGLLRLTRRQCSLLRHIVVYLVDLLRSSRSLCSLLRHIGTLIMVTWWSLLRPTRRQCSLLRHIVVCSLWSLLRHIGISIKSSWWRPLRPTNSLYSLLRHIGKCRWVLRLGVWLLTIKWCPLSVLIKFPLSVWVMYSGKSVKQGQGLGILNQRIKVSTIYFWCYLWCLKFGRCWNTRQVRKGRSQVPLKKKKGKNLVKG